MSTRRTPLMDISNNDVTSTPVATGSRRKSGRAVKLPEKFIPNAPSSQHANSSGKRKRDGEDVENDASDVEEVDEDSDGTVESEADEVPAPRKRATVLRKPAAKKPKVNGTASHGEAPAMKIPSRPKKEKTKKILIADRNATGLYADIFTSGMNLEDIAGQFLEQYEDNKVATVVEMVNLVLKSAGCDLQVTDDDVEDPDNVGTKLGDMQQEYQEQNIADYPLVQRAKSSAAFRANLANFFKALIAAMHKSGVMYEENVPLIENVHLWFATMTSCTSRPFRHTASLVSLSVTSGLCSMVAYEAENAANIRRQFEGEKKMKKGANKGRLADYQQKVEISEKKQEVLKEKINEFFETVYVHRYRDIDPKIRTECVEAIGDWIDILPSVFLEGAYLRYMGWMLSDTYAPVRHEVVKQLHRILENDANHGTMRHFVERFRPRMIEMATQDSEPDVRASAVELANSIREAGMLEPDDIDAIGKLIFDSEKRVRTAVVPFLVQSQTEVYDLKVEELGGEDDLDEVLTVDDEDFNSPRKGWIKLKALGELLHLYDVADQDEMPSQIQTRNDSDFLNVSGTESRFTRAAQALYDKTPELKEWQMLAGYLLFDHSSRPTRSKLERAFKETLKPEEREEVVLLEVLNAVVILALEEHSKFDEPEKATEKSRKKLTKAEILESKKEAARRLAGLIPRLLKKYGADPKTATIVLRLEHVLDLDIFQELRQSVAYSKLLDEISMQFTSHADRGVLAEAGASLLHAKNSGEQLEEVTDNKIQSLWEDTTNTLRQINKAGEIAIRGSLRDSILTDLSHNLARLDKLASISNCVEQLEAAGTRNEPLPINILLDVVGRGIFEEEDPDLDALEDEVVLSAIRSSMFYFMWKMHALTGSISAGEEIPDVDVDTLKDLQDTFSTNLISALSSRATIDPVRLFATGTLLDLHVLFSTLKPARPSKAKNGVAAELDEHLQSLVKEIDTEVQQEITSIFDQAEKLFAKKANKKLAEPGEDEAPAHFEEEPEDEEDDEDATDGERHAEALKAEQQLCELTGKLVLAILAKVIDASGPLQGKLRSRIQRNKDKLGPNFKQVVAYLVEPKKPKSHRSKAEQIATAAKKASAKAPAKSGAIVPEDEEEDEDDPFAEREIEEGDEEDLRRRELDEEPAASVVEENEDADEDDIMGD